MRKTVAALLGALLLAGAAAASEVVTVRVNKTDEPDTDGYVLEVYIDGVLFDTDTDWMDGGTPYVDYLYETWDGELIQAYLWSQGSADYDLELYDSTATQIDISKVFPVDEPDYVGGENLSDEIFAVPEASEILVAVQVQKYDDQDSDGYSVDVYVNDVLVETDTAALAGDTWDYRYLLYDGDIIEAFLTSLVNADYDLALLYDTATEIDASAERPLYEPEYVAGEIVIGVLEAFDDDHETDDDAAEADCRGYLDEATDLAGLAYDDDYFVISVEAGYEVLDITLTFDHAQGNVDLYLLDFDGTSVLDFSESTSSNESISCDVVDPGDYYLWVVPVAADGNTYTLRWDGSAPGNGDVTVICTPSSARGGVAGALVSLALLAGGAVALMRRRVNA